MSTIVAVEKDRRTIIASDTLTTSGPMACVNSLGLPKVTRIGSSFVGSTGFSVYKNVLDHYLAGKRAPTLKDERAILDFFIRFWKALHEHYHFVNDQSREDDTSPFAELDTEFLVVNRYGIFQVEDILGVTRYERYCAIGSGASRAEGALEVLMGQDMTAGEIATEAIRVAMMFDRSSGGDVIVYDVQAIAAPRKRRKVSRTRRS
ncbi:MAG: hypothetical protein IIC02_09775 [Planctomycetes bacterium]|nr:hypothetical protein [Planctomycetota bacterium]